MEILHSKIKFSIMAASIRELIQVFCMSEHLKLELISHPVRQRMLLSYFVVVFYSNSLRRSGSQEKLSHCMK